MKILHLGDIHIQSGSYGEDVEDALTRAAGIANDEKVDLVVIGGDVFDSASTPQQRLVFSKFLCSLQHPEHTVVIRGNHDQRDDLRLFGYHGFVSVHEEPKIEMLPITGGKSLQILTLPHFNPSLAAREELSLHGMVENGNGLMDDILEHYFQQVHTHDGPSIVVAHGSVDGAEYREGYVPKDNGLHFSRAKLEALGCPVLLDHIHRHQALSHFIVYSGSVARGNYGEAGHDKGCILWEYRHGAWTWEFRSLNPRPMYNLTAIWTQGAFKVDYPDESENWQPAGCRARFVYDVDEAEINQVDLRRIHEIFPGAHELKIEMRPRLSTATRTAEIAEARTVPDKLALWAKAKGYEDKMPALMKCHAEITGDGM